MLSVAAENYIGPAEWAPRNREHNGNRFETIGTAQYTNQRRYIMNELGEADQIENPPLQAAFDSSLLPSFITSLLGIKKIHPSGANMQEDQIEVLNYGAETYTPLTATMTTNADERTYEAEPVDYPRLNTMKLIGKHVKIPISTRTSDLPAQDLSIMTDLAINRNSNVQMGTPILYDS